MTPDELKKLIENGPTDKMVAALAPLTEAERKKLSRTVVAMRKEHSRRITIDDRVSPFSTRPDLAVLALAGWTEAQRIRMTIEDPMSPFSTRLKLAVLALAGWTEGKRFRVADVAHPNSREPRSREFLLQVLSDRKPDWLAKWADMELESTALGDWDFVRSLIRAQLCPKPQRETYILKMLNRYFGDNRSLKDRLLEDPDLLNDEIWRIFELSPAHGTILHSGDVTFVPRGGQSCFSWSSTLLALAAEGKVDRQRLLAASLDSLLRNTEARNTAWFAKFHELLEPTAEERLSLQASYLQLLGHPVPAVAGLALDAVAALEKAQKLDEIAFVEGVAPVFHLQPKGQPLSAVKVLGRIAARKKVPASKIATALLAGLAHPAVQVQQALVEVLGKLKEDTADIIASQLPALLESLAPSVLEQARKFVSAPASPACEAESSAAMADLLEEAARISAPWRERAGIDAVLRALEGTGEWTGVAFDPMALPRLDPARRVEPIQTLDELIERLTIALEALDDAIEFELLLDGLSRLCDQRPMDFEARVAPLVLRSETILWRGELPTITTIGLRSALVKVLRAWCGSDVRGIEEDRDSLLGFLERRLDKLMARLRERRASPLLACPTHRPGWIDSREMLRRLEWYEQHGVEPSQHDFIQGCLRLAPDHRAETLAEASRLQGSFAAAFRFALGGPLEDASLPRAVLAAAGRARTPFADLGELHVQGTLTGPDAAEAARYFWDEGQPSDLWHWIPAEALLHLGVQPSVPAPEHIGDLPTVLLHAWIIPGEMHWAVGNAAGVLGWIETVWPANPDPFFVIGIRLRQAPFMVASTYRLRAGFLAPLFDPDVPFTEMAQLLLALALNQAETEVTGLAVDALIELIRDGRCVGPELGRALRFLVRSDLLKLNRLARHLDTAARASLLHAHVCARIVQTACGELTDIPRDMHHLLGPLLEWLAALGQGVHSDFRPVLARATKGNAAVHAGRLLQLTFAPESAQRFLISALEGRLHRALRWAALDAG
jgi:hypothetical protein